MSVSAAAVEATRKLLTDTRVDKLNSNKMAGQKVTILRDTATVEQALKELARFKILSAPVVAPPSEEHLDETPTWPMGTPAADTLGFVDIRDILCSFLRDLEVKNGGLPNFFSLPMLQQIRMLEEQGLIFAQKPLARLHTMGFDGDFMHMSQFKSSLLEFTMKGLLHPQARGIHEGNHDHIVHRIAFFDKDGCIRNIISQTDLIRFLAAHKADLGPLQDCTIETLGMAERAVETITPDTSAISAMAMMKDKNLSALGVVDKEGRLIGNFSTSDVRAINTEHFGALGLPVGEFLALENKAGEFVLHNMHPHEAPSTEGRRFATYKSIRKRPHVPGEEVGQELVMCGRQETFGEIISKLAEHSLHRVYVVDENVMPIGIITCTDVLRKLVAICI